MIVNYNIQLFLFFLTRVCSGSLSDLTYDADLDPLFGRGRNPVSQYWRAPNLQRVAIEMSRQVILWSAVKHKKSISKTLVTFQKKLLPSLTIHSALEGFKHETIGTVDVGQHLLVSQVPRFVDDLQLLLQMSLWLS